MRSGIIFRNLLKSAIVPCHLDYKSPTGLKRIYPQSNGYGEMNALFMELE